MEGHPCPARALQVHCIVPFHAFNDCSDAHSVLPICVYNLFYFVLLCHLPDVVFSPYIHALIHHHGSSPVPTLSLLTFASNHDSLSFHSLDLKIIFLHLKLLPLSFHSSLIRISRPHHSRAIDVPCRPPASERC